MLLLILTLSLVAFLCLIFLQRKHRAIWQELFELREQNALLRKNIVEVRKQTVINRVLGSTRLPARMTSQYGEDVLLWKFFQNKRDGFYIDVGAYDGVGFSNTYFFEAIGWDGILVEAVPRFYESCVAARPHSRVINAVINNGKTRETEFSIAEGNNGVGTLSFAGDNKKQVERIEREGGKARTTTLPS